MFLYPRLPHAVSSHIADAVVKEGVLDLREKWYARHPRAVFTPVGGSQVREDHLMSLRAALVDASNRGGFPHSVPNPTEIDCAWADVLRERMQVIEGETGRAGLWPFLCCVLVPDLIRWRWPDGKPERFLDGRRNALGRLWRISMALSEGGTNDLMRRLGSVDQDIWQQLVERPSIAGCYRTSRSLAEAFLEAYPRHPGLRPARRWFRDVQKRMLRLSSFVSFETLDGPRLAALTANVVRCAAEALTTAEGGMDQEDLSEAS